MKRILIATDVVYAEDSTNLGNPIADYKDINKLSKGAIAIFTEDNRLLSAANANAVFTTLPDTKAIYIAVGTGVIAKGAKVSGLIDRNTIRVDEIAYVAPVAEIQYVGGDGTATGNLNLPSPLIVGSTALLRVTDISSGTQPVEQQKRYEYVVRAGDTSATIIDATKSYSLVSQINADKDSPVTAAAVTTPDGIQLTTKNFNQKIVVSMDGIIFNATNIKDGAGVSVAMVYGVGTPTDVAALELECSAVEGNTNQIYQSQYWYKNTTDVDPAQTYALWNFAWSVLLERPTGAQHPSRQLITLALPDNPSDLVLADLQTVITEAFGVNRINLETGA